MITKIESDMPLGLVRKIRDRMERELLVYCDETDPDDERARWISDMARWSECGPGSYMSLRQHFFDGNMEGLLEPLKEFRRACSRVYELETNAVSHGDLIAC